MFNDTIKKNHTYYNNIKKLNPPQDPFTHFNSITKHKFIWNALNIKTFFLQNCVRLTKIL